MSAHTASFHLRESELLEENRRQLDGEASPRLSYDSEPSESNRTFDVDTWSQSSDEEMHSAFHRNLPLPVRSALAVRLLYAYHNSTQTKTADQRIREFLEFPEGRGLPADHQRNQGKGK